MTFQNQLVCLHGFLGCSSDWDVSLQKNNYQTVRFDFFRKFSPHILPDIDLPNLGTWINHQVSSQKSKKVLLGYSFGGRIGLHSLIQSSDLWSGAIIISSHIGLHDSDEKFQRVQSDLKWAERFENENWNSVIQDWNSQKVFSNSVKEPLRLESDYNRISLGRAFRKCSLGLQNDLRPQLKKINIPILWISGENDLKFSQISKEAASLNSSFEFRSISNSSHRVLFDQPKNLHEEILIWLDKINF